MISGQGDHIHRESMYKLCAYNFPAVAVTIGSKRWPELRPTYHTLLSTQSEDVQRSLAASLHIVAPLLCSPSVQRTSLVFALNTLLAGAPSNIKQCTLLHLHVTLNQVPVDVAMPFLELFPRLAEMDAESEDCSMWRLREAVARQLTHLAVLYGAAPTNSLFMPVALELCKDVVWAVRMAGITAVEGLLRGGMLQEETMANLWGSMLSMAQSTRHALRQVSRNGTVAWAESFDPRYTQVVGSNGPATSLSTAPLRGFQKSCRHSRRHGAAASRGVDGGHVELRETSVELVAVPCGDLAEGGPAAAWLKAALRRPG
ncbi:hypothetical protein CYMTET_50618 [Cymbomonas tetramitiformis]|uniref:Uncharacterized protein n=1 Tax=Cymbomonas tetramitiformis TaxID=36881 RepID=A0AAE0BMP1_9CHLO|nr:hypothetical protein CYMTET_50618 [Cymbomonas tetramitiformis]